MHAHGAKALGPYRPLGCRYLPPESKGTTSIASDLTFLRFPFFLSAFFLSHA